MSFPSLLEAEELLSTEAQELVGLLTLHRVKLVLAESCTGGMAAATLAGIPGVSDHFCGSLVAYRLDSKSAWLGISPKTLSKTGAVTEQVALEMAVRALEVTPEAGLAASITGYLGPLAPKNQDGLIYCGLALRSEDSERMAVFASINRLAAPKGLAVSDLRKWRQMAASHSLLMMVRSLLQETAENSDSANESSTTKSETHDLRRKKVWKPSERAPKKASKKTKRSN